MRPVNKTPLIKEKSCKIIEETKETSTYKTAVTEQQDIESSKNEISICEKCRFEANLPIWTSINSTEMPTLRESLLNNNPYDCICAKCGVNIKFAHTPLLYHDPENEFAIHYFPNPNEDDINAFNTNAIDFPYERLRVVFEYEDLLEKIRIFEAKLNDKVTEICKAVILRTHREKLNIPGCFTFFGLSSDNKYLIFHNSPTPTEDDQSSLKPIEGSLFINFPLWRSIFIENKKPITGGLYIEMSKEIYKATGNDKNYDYRSIKGRWETVDINYTIGQILGESAKKAALKTMDENTMTDISKFWL